MSIDKEAIRLLSVDAWNYIGPNAKPFPLVDKITRPITSLGDLEKIFESPNSRRPVHLTPTINQKFSPPTAEYVPLTLIAGGADAAKYKGSFLVYPKDESVENRGRQKVVEICQGYQNGRLLDPNKPQEYYEYQGYYYVTRGRHSTAALIALGIDHIPALVTHISD